MGEAERSFDDDGDEVMYRSCAGEEEVPFELPEMAMPISRQRAKFDISSMTPAWRQRRRCLVGSGRVVGRSTPCENPLERHLFGWRAVCVLRAMENGRRSFCVV